MKDETGQGMKAILKEIRAANPKADHATMMKLLAERIREDDDVQRTACEWLIEKAEDEDVQRTACERLIEKAEDE